MDKKRVQESILSRPERRILNWFCLKMPSWVSPDTLTFTTFFSAIFMLLFYHLAKYNRYFLFVVSFFILLVWFGDSLDGSLARFRKRERPKYGYYIDHLLDFVTVFIIYFGFIAYGIGVIPASLVLAAYSLLFCHSIVLCSINKELTISFGKISPTEIRILLIIINLLLFLKQEHYVEIIFYVFSIVTLIYASYEITKTAIKLNKEDMLKINNKFKKKRS